MSSRTIDDEEFALGAGNGRESLVAGADAGDAARDHIVVAERRLAALLPDADH